MEAIMIEMFKPDKIKTISVDEKIYGEANCTSIKFAYDGGKMPPICIDGNFKLFRFRKKHGDIYSLSITCDVSDEFFFREICKVISKETCKLVRKSICKPEEFELVKKINLANQFMPKYIPKSLERLNVEYLQGLLGM